MIAQELIAHITDTTDLEVTGFEPLRIANMAGRMLTGLRQWNWTVSAETDLAAVANQSYVSLPADFGSFVGHPRVPDSVSYTFRLVTPDVISEKRSYTVAEFGNYCGAVVFRQKAPTAKPPDNERVPVLEVYPTPTEADPDFLRCFYRIAWTDVTDDNDQVPIPPYMELAYVQLVRALARGWEEEDQGSADARMAQVLAGPIFRAAIVEDGHVQMTQGFIRGGMGDPGGVLHQWANVGIVEGPST